MTNPKIEYVMKTKIVLIATFMMITMISADAMAQRGRRAPDVRPQQTLRERPAERPERMYQGDMTYCMMLPDLTEEQEEQIRSLRLAQIERSTKHRAEMAELRARKRNLMTGVSDGDIDGLIDQMTTLRGERMKENVKHHQAVRELLTEEQRILYDSKVMRRSGGRDAYHRQPAGRDGGHAPRGGRGRW